ncbi:DNA modification methylase [Canibacter sp. lx-45]|uniref:DNA modification methylase n=1 Tax=Canibacter zhuwentaonis TaxID=2837491 RepID=UPI001BDC0C15|nr:DNA modification methylase [Canibacter zhuwentaonis]MBT1034889.1 DNA modification methylase [Canibacter zhuwentaonis]
MKTRTVKFFALAGVLAVSLSGCSLVAPVATTKPYSASDGINQDINGINLRNIMLVGAKSGKPLNVVFTAVNNTGDPQIATMKFIGSDGTEAQVKFLVPEGVTQYGDPRGAAENINWVDLGAQEIGSTATAYLQVSGSNEERVNVPVLDGTLDEYKPYAVTPPKN